MSTFYIKNSQIDGNRAKIVGNDVKHIRKVLRFEINDVLDICDEQGNIYKGKITEFSDKDEILCEIQEMAKKQLETPYRITLYQGVPKGDKFETIIQKCTELGVSGFVPVQMARSIAKVTGNNEDKKLERWNKISAEAAKQCGRQRVPTVDMAINFENIIENISKYDIVIVPYESEENISIKQVLNDVKSNIASIAIVIGPEGGFSGEEIATLIEKGARICTLGPRILRTETAGIVAVSMINYELEL